MGDTTHVRIYESDKEKIEAMIEDGNMPAKIREMVNKASAWEERGSDVL